MKVYPLRNDQGEMFAFENEVHVQFALNEDEYEVWEPYGDGSRLWIGSKASPEVPASIGHLASCVGGNWPGPISAARAKLIDKMLAMFR